MILGLGYVALPYLWGRLGRAAAEMEWNERMWDTILFQSVSNLFSSWLVLLRNIYPTSRGTISRPSHNQRGLSAFKLKAWSALKGLETMYRLTSLANMLAFLRTGVYRWNLRAWCLPRTDCHNKHRSCFPLNPFGAEASWNGWPGPGLSMSGPSWLAWFPSNTSIDSWYGKNSLSYCSLPFPCSTFPRYGHYWLVCFLGYRGLRWEMSCIRAIQEARMQSAKWPKNYSSLQWTALSARALKSFSLLRHSLVGMSSATIASEQIVKRTSHSHAR